MPRYIDADALKESLKELEATGKGANPKYLQGIQDAIDGYFPQIIDDEPTADVEPIRHGRWKWLTQKEAEPYAPFGMVFSAENWICSECNNYKTFGIGMQPKYCDNCGAKMDGGE